VTEHQRSEMKSTTGASATVHALPLTHALKKKSVYSGMLLRGIALTALTFTVVIGVSIRYTPSPAVTIERDPKINTAIYSAINLLKPDAIFIGNSTLRFGVDYKMYSQRTGIKSLRFSLDGSASACWYLMFKNVILNAPHTPKVVVFFFRDAYLTDPSFRVTGNYKPYVDQYAGPAEPVLDQLAYQEHMNTMTYFLSRHWPMYRQRDQIKANMVESAKNTLPSLLLEKVDINQSIDRVFDEKHMDGKQLTRRQLAAESTGNVRRNDFAANVENSFLPEIIRLAKENNIGIIFVRMKRRRDLKENSQSPNLLKYADDLRQYLEVNNAEMIDFTHEKRILEKHFDVGDHLSVAEGKALFTQLLAERMGPVMKKMVDR
jgi:hypothetical protein